MEKLLKFREIFMKKIKNLPEEEYDNLADYWDFSKLFGNNHILYDKIKYLRGYGYTWKDISNIKYRDIDFKRKTVQLKSYDR